MAKTGLGHSGIRKSRRPSIRSRVVYAAQPGGHLQPALFRVDPALRVPHVALSVRVVGSAHPYGIVILLTLHP